MIRQRNPDDLVVTEKDFADCGWKGVLSNTTRQTYSSMFRTIGAAAEKEMIEGKQAYGKVLWLLTTACSMILSPTSTDESPFKPLYIFSDGSTSAIPDDFLGSDIEFFVQILHLVEDPKLKARLADLVWIKRRPREVQFPLVAIDNYRSISLDLNTWNRDGRECWERAIGLACMLGTGARTRLAEMEVAIIDACMLATTQDGVLSLQLTDVLQARNLGRGRAAEIAHKLKLLAVEFDGEGDLDYARQYFRGSARWFKTAGNNAESASMTVLEAEVLVKNAIARLTSANPRHTEAAFLYENAIQTYRTIPRTERSIHRVDERIAELHAHLKESGEKSLDEAILISSPEMDITQLVENAQNAVRGKTAVEALKEFANLGGGTSSKELRDNATALLREPPLHLVTPRIIKSRDGRVIAKRPSMSLDAERPDDNEVVILWLMIRDYSNFLDKRVLAYILPALEVLLLEHRLREDDFVGPASLSPIVPKGRERLFGKALFAGYDRDFVTALHLLVPQIEHMVRYHLKQSGAKTTTLDTEGIENENAMSTLMALPEADKVFGEDLSFEIRALFCDPFGPNLRNRLAHGLLDDQDCQSNPAIYAWWLGLRLVFNTFWNAAQKAPADNGSEEH